MRLNVDGEKESRVYRVKVIAYRREKKRVKGRAVEEGNGE